MVLESGTGLKFEEMPTKLIRLSPQPGKLWACWSIFPRPNSILPVISSNEIAAWVADHRDIEFSKSIENVCSIAVLVGEGTFRVVDASIDATAHVSD